MNVREATAEDFPAMIEMGRAMHHESEFRFLPYDVAKLRSMTENYIRDDDKICTVCESDGKLVGMLIGYVAPYYFCHEKIACELLWYVVPEKRGSRAGVKLLMDFGYWAQSKGAKELAISISTGVNVDKFTKMLSRLGFAHRGGNYKLRIG